MGRFIQFMSQPAIQKRSNSSPRWGLILATLLSALLSVAYLYITPAFEFKIQLSIFSTVSWSPLWPGFTGVMLLVACAKLFEGIVPPAAGDILVFYPKISLLLQQSQRKLRFFINTMTEGISNSFTQIFVRSQSLLRYAQKRLSAGTPGFVMILVLTLLFYTFVMAN
ncbi:MAG: hypothetical protein WBM99_05640 [Psychromonas sp.]